MLKTPAAPSHAQAKILRSTFICFLFPARTAEEARERIGAHAREYANATHNCFAYICGFGQETQYFSDAGEPHGTAGKPILNALLRNNMTNTLAIVTRYYGGIKLGVKGLIEAYGGTVEAALAEARLVGAIATELIRISVDYALVDLIGARVRELGGQVLPEEWSQRASLAISLPAAQAPVLREYLDGFRLQSRLDYL